MRDARHPPSLQARVRGFCRRHTKENYPRAPYEERAAVSAHLVNTMMKQVPATLREMYVQQANENGMVKKKLKLLDHYKLVGAVLIKQDWDEAKSNIIKRLKFIENEL
ncbi:hypothetical protein Pcac1_g14625 [Phytophthora cactorum]|nr:hypothetical protein Pcac1_g14625 [Phytophthora cactorum]